MSRELYDKLVAELNSRKKGQEPKQENKSKSKKAKKEKKNV